MWLRYDKITTEADCLCPPWYKPSDKDYTACELLLNKGGGVDVASVDASGTLDYAFPGIGLELRLIIIADVASVDDYGFPGIVVVVGSVDDSVG